MQYQRGSIGLFFRGDPTLVGWWDFEQGSTNKAGIGNNGTDTSISYVPSKFGLAPYFNGSSSYITVNNYSAINFVQSQPFSVSIWVYPTVYPGAQKILVNKQKNTTDEWCYSFLIDSNNKINFDVCKQNVNAASVIDPNVMTLKTWTHYVGVWTGNVGGSNNLLLYKNGILVATASYTTTGATQSLANLWLGRSYHSLSYNYTGLIDEVAIFSRALSPQEISQYYSWAIGANKKIYLSLVYLSLEGNIYYRTLSAVETTNNSLSYVSNFYRTISAIETSAVNVLKTIPKSISTVSVSLTTLIATQLKLALMSIQSIANSTISTIKTNGRIMLASVVSISQMNLLKTFYRTLSATAVSVASLIKSVLTNVFLSTSTAVITAISTIYKKILQTTATVLTSLIASFTYGIYLTVSVISKIKFYVNGALIDKFKNKYFKQNTAFNDKYTPPSSNWWDKYT